jgi:hypothetical protein
MKTQLLAIFIVVSFIGNVFAQQQYVEVLQKERIDILHATQNGESTQFLSRLKTKRIGSSGLMQFDFTTIEAIQSWIVAKNPNPEINIRLRGNGEYAGDINDSVDLV